MTLRFGHAWANKMISSSIHFPSRSMSTDSSFGKVVEERAFRKCLLALASIRDEYTCEKNQQKNLFSSLFKTEISKKISWCQNFIIFGFGFLPAAYLFITYWILIEHFQLFFFLPGVLSNCLWSPEGIWSWPDLRCSNFQRLSFLGKLRWQILFLFRPKVDFCSFRFCRCSKQWNEAFPTTWTFLAFECNLQRFTKTLYWLKTN